VKLQFPFIQLPLRFDAAALAAEIAALDEAEWLPHPQGFPGNSALPLVAVNGDRYNDGLAGPMRPTAVLQQLPLLRRVLGSFGAVVGRTRLMRLEGNAEVTPHIDQGHYWAERMRVHVPIVTTPTVRFYCGEAVIHMAAGECWIFDTWRLHRVHNDAADSRIHLVMDTVGGDGLWDLLMRSRPHHAPLARWSARAVELIATAEPALEFESTNLSAVMSPWELRAHVGFLFGEALAHPNLAALHQKAMDFLRSWQALWAAQGESVGAWPKYRAILDRFNADVRKLGAEIPLRNQLSLAGAMQILVIKAALSDQRAATKSPSTKAPTRSDDTFDRPVFIVSPPRSGSTMLFETLAGAREVFTIGDESHGLIEGIVALHPATRDFDSNRLDTTAATEGVTDQLRERFLAALRDRDGKPAPSGRMRMLEKTPKNSLRVPFLASVFSEAQFVYLYRHPHEVLASMIEAWQSGRFCTYPNLPGWNGLPWSLLLTPGWRDLAGKPLHEIVAAQWQATTDALLDDLDALPRERVHIARYDALVADPAVEIARLSAALDIDFDRPLDRRLPLSRFTLSKPDPDKWRRHAEAIALMLPKLKPTIDRAEEFARR
jgi:Sulfotransferase family/Aspartyl/Asparaginyl beta-hydroxylase